MNLLRAYNPKLFDLIQPYRVTRDEDMPIAYQKASGGRYLRNDLGIMTDNPNSLLAKAQPWQSVPRMDFFYKPPMPFKILSGNVEKVEQLWDMRYPLLSPGAMIVEREVVTVGGRFMLPHLVVDQAGPGLTKWGVWIGGRWVECFWRYHHTVLGHRFSSYSGFRPDYAAGFTDKWEVRSDAGAWFPDISASFRKEE